MGSSPTANAGKRKKSDWNYVLPIIASSHSTRIIGSLTRIVRFLCLSFMVSGVLSSADILPTPKGNITSANVVYGKRSDHENGGMELESLTASNTCFFGGGCGVSSLIETATCNKGAYVYQITGYSGSSLGPSISYATRFDIVCSDGSTASIGSAGTWYSYQTIINPQGYDGVMAGGGCITDRIQIGGTDFGNAGYGTLSSCSCAPGLKFVGFGTLQYENYWPSFPYMSIQCDYACPHGTYYYGGSCYNCLGGMNSGFVYYI